MNQFNTITTKKKIVQITIRQSEHQQIQVTCNGVSHTESFSVYSNTPYTIQVQPEMWYSPGELNIPAEGVFTKDTTITISPATLQADYDIKFTVDYQPHAFSQYPNYIDKSNIGANVTADWSTETDGIYFGTISQPYNIIDRIEVSNTSKSIVAPDITEYNFEGIIIGFYGPNKPPVDIGNTIFIYIIDPEEISHSLFVEQGFPVSLVINAGDICYYSYETPDSINYFAMTPVELYDLFVKFRNKAFRIVIKIV